MECSARPTHQRVKSTMRTKNRARCALSSPDSQNNSSVTSWRSSSDIMGRDGHNPSNIWPRGDKAVAGFGGGGSVGVEVFMRADHAGVTMTASPVSEMGVSGEVPGQRQYHRLMENHRTRDEYDVATAQIVVVLGGAGQILSEAIRSSSGLDVLDDNSAMVAFLLLWLSGPMRSGEIAEAMNITTGGSTKIVTKLENDGIVSRLHHADADGRAVVVTLTEKGERVADAVLVAVGEAVRDLMARLNALDASAR